jgi:UDP-2,3-diacylglucosamine hydrolase
VKPTLFLSDLHLSPERPALVEAFRAFCAGPARAAERVYVLGDLFDAWVGDEQLREGIGAAVAGALREVAGAGVEVAVLAGNRDFLLGERFAAAAGATLLPERLVVDVAGAPTLLLHGDELCTGDLAYQRYRAFVRAPRWQRRFLALPFRVRRAIGRWLRRGSERAVAAKAEAIMDADAAAVDAAFRAHGVARIVHGHTHRPARHHVVVDGRACERWVLADWYARGSYLAFDADGGHVHEVAPGAP